MTGCIGLLGGGHSSPTLAGGGGGSFNPSTYGSVLAWYDFTDSSKVQDNVGASVGNGGSVDRVVDKSSNAFDARQTSSGSRPTVITAALNGYQVLDFDGTDDLLTLPSSAAVVKNLAGITLVSVHNVDQVASANGLFNFNGSSGHRVRWRHLGGDGQWSLQTVAQDGGTDNEFYSGGGNVPSVDAWYINVAVIDFAGNAAKTWVNGVQKSTSSNIGSSGNCSNTNATEDPTIYGCDPYGNQPFNGQAAMFLIYSGAMNDTNRDNLEAALGTLLGITVV